MPGMAREVFMQIFWRTFGFAGMPVTFQISAEQTGSAANTIDCEHEVEHRANEWHHPNEPNPGNRRAGITFEQNGMARSQHR
jgi:hypothetical protein